MECLKVLNPVAIVRFLVDLLSQLLLSFSIRHSVFAGLKAGGDWAIDFPAPDGIKFNAVLDGSCWLRVDGGGAPVQLHAGDCFLLPARQAFVLGSDPELPTVSAEQVYLDTRGGIATWGEADSFMLIGGRFDFGAESDLLFSGMPPAVVVREGTDQASVLNWALRQLAHELATPSQGQATVVQQLGMLMLVQVLRLYLVQAGPQAWGWLPAIADARLGPVMQAIHAQPQRHWTVAQLAAVAGVSRSTFALHFRKKAGLPPLSYVMRWRMQLAGRLLLRGRSSISAIAQQLGYESDSAFSHAFRRVMHCSPSQYRRPG